MTEIFRIVEKDATGRLVAIDFDGLATFLAAADARGWKVTGVRADNPGRIKLRPQLVGKPKFDASAGPAWGGEENGRPVIRYESWVAYERLSA